MDTVSNIWWYISQLITCLNVGVDTMETIYSFFGLSILVLFIAGVLVNYFQRFIFRGFL